MQDVLDQDYVTSCAETLLNALAPEEKPFSDVYLKPLIEMALEDEIVVLDRVEHAGGFGRADLLVITVAPLVIEWLRNPVHRKDPERLTKEMAEKTQSPSAMRKVKALAELLPNLPQQPR